MAEPPVIDIDMDAFWQDPYPALADLRASAPVAFVPQLDGIVMTRRDDISVWEKRIDVFSSEPMEKRYFFSPSNGASN